MKVPWSPLRANALPEGQPHERWLAELTAESRVDLDFTFLMTASALIGSFGLLIDSAAVIIGAMVIAPLVGPIRGAALGAVEGEWRLLGQAIATTAFGIALVAGVAFAVGALMPLPASGHEVLTRTQPTVIDLGIALVAGAVAAFARVRPRVGDALPGTAIAVALVPPLCVSGLCLAKGMGPEAAGAALTFLTNLLGIALASMGVYLARGFIRRPDRPWLPLAVALGATVALSVPLGYAFWHLMLQARLTESVKQLLVERTLTFGRDGLLVATRVDWRQEPPEVTLTIRSPTTPTPRQLALVQGFLERQLGRPLRLVVDVERVERVEPSPTR